jgi:hypothetical protein
MILPLTVVFIFKFFTSAISSGVTKKGPIGPKDGADLPIINCPDFSN